MSILHNPHPPIQALDPSTFEYSSYPFQHCSVSLGTTTTLASPTSSTSTPHKIPSPGVLLITLNRPDQLNAFTNEQCHSLIFLFQLADLDQRVKVVVLTGAGKAFCAGADLSGSRDDTFGVSSTLTSPLVQHRDGGGQLVLSILSCRKLVIAAINGVAVGIGLTMTFPADLRIGCEQSKIGVPFVKRGIACDAISSYLLPRLLGWSGASRLLMTGDLVKTSEAWLADLFYRLVPSSEEVLPEALRLAARLSQENSVTSIALCKSQLWRGATTPEEVHLQESRAIAWCALHGDAKEGVASFMQKRPAQFKGTLDHLTTQGWYPWWSQTHVQEGCLRGGQGKL